MIAVPSRTMPLTGPQSGAVHRLGQDVCVVAGPGSGKTKVLIERFCWLITEKGYDPGRLLAITFTEKAATEIKQRLVKALEHTPQIRERVERAWVSTVHGFCMRLLRENAIAAGVPPNFSVLDETESHARLLEFTERALDEIYCEQPVLMRALFEAVDASTSADGMHPDLARCLISVYEAIRAAGVPLDQATFSPQPKSHSELIDSLQTILSETVSLNPKQESAHKDIKQWAVDFLALPRSPIAAVHFQTLNKYDFHSGRFKLGTRTREIAKSIKECLRDAVRADFLYEYYVPLRDLIHIAVQRLDRLYRLHKQELGALDFSDLEEFAIRLLRDNGAVHARIQSSFDQILMDELQDTNPLQWQLLDLLRGHENFFAVGDINQSIYGFRHADPQAFQQYRQRILGSGKVVDDLRENYRSRSEILAAVNLLIEDQPGVEPRELIPAIDYPAKDVPSVEVIVACHPNPDEGTNLEASWIASRIREMEGNLLISEQEKAGRSAEQRPARFKDMAILVRAFDSLAAIERALKQFDVPYFVIGGRTFFETREVMDLTQYLRVLSNPTDEVSLAGVLRSPFAGVSDETMFRLCVDSGLSAAIEDLPRLDTKAFPPEDLDRLIAFRKQLEHLRGLAGAVSPDRLLARALDESDYWSGIPGRARRNIEKFLAILRDRTQAKPRELPELLKEIEWLRESRNEPEALPDAEANVVSLMSIHGAKGLEFSIVFLPALQRSSPNTKPVISYSPGMGIGVKWRDPITATNSDSDTAHALYCRAMEEREKQENNRLFYVALTRAREHLILSYTKSDKKVQNLAALIEQKFPVDATTPAVAIRQVYEPPPFTNPAREIAREKEEQLLPAPPLTGQYDSTASVTSVSLFATCPRKYYLSRYLGLEALDDFDGRSGADDGFLSSAKTRGATEFGLLVHSMLSSAPEPSSNTTPEQQEARTLVQNFHASELGRRLTRAARIQREFDFRLACEDIVLSGQIDLWFEEGGQLVLLDYKTDQLKDGVTERAEAYALQLRLYALALERLAGRLPDQAYIYYLRSSRAESVTLAATELEAAKQTVRTFRDAQSSRNFPLVINQQCFRCPFFKNSCPAAKMKSPGT